MTANNKFSFQKTVQSLARVLARIKPTPWEKVCTNYGATIKRNIFMKIRCVNYMGGVFMCQVQTLYRYCPQENAAGVFCLDSRAQDAVIALGLYFLESGCQHEQQIIPYLLRLAKSLPKAVWVDDGQPSKTDSKCLLN